MTMVIPETSQPMASPAAFANMVASPVLQVAVSSIQSQAANGGNGDSGGPSTTTALNTLSNAQVTAAVARGMPQEQAQQAGDAYTKALVQHISNGLPMGEAVALAQKTFQIEASFPVPKSPQEAVVKNIASSDMAQNVNAKLAALAGAKTSEGTQAFEKALAVAMLKGGDFSDAVKSAQNAVQQAETLARADKTPQASLANGNAKTDVFAKTSPGYQRALSSLLAKGIPIEQAMAKAEQTAADADAAAEADAKNPMVGLSSGNFSALDKFPLQGSFGKTLGVLMNRGVPAAQAMEMAVKADAEEQRAIQADARSELVGFSKGGNNALPQGDAHFDHALAQAVSRGESPANAIRIARKVVEKLPTEVQTPTTALASGKNVDTLLSSPGNSRIFKQALGNALARGVPVEEAIALARRAEAANAFRYPLPQSLAKLITSSRNKVEVTTDSGKPLPAWLRFDISSKSFVAAEVPSGALPLRAIVALSGQRFTLDVTEGAMPK
ncbi:MAG: hypothetical protein IPH35_05845 [Rhodoferax sp.]|nr:hypothetical protein [Rhodoferax sp.]